MSTTCIFYVMENNLHEICLLVQLCTIVTIRSWWWLRWLLDLRGRAAKKELEGSRNANSDADSRVVTYKRAKLLLAGWQDANLTVPSALRKPSRVNQVQPSVNSSVLQGNFEAAAAYRQPLPPVEYRPSSYRPFHPLCLGGSSRSTTCL